MNGYATAFASGAFGALVVANVLITGCEVNRFMLVLIVILATSGSYALGRFSV